MKFFGRELELNKMCELLKKETASLVVIKGRRRIGKSRLTLEFGKKFARVLSFSGSPPSNGLNAQDQRDDFAGQMSRSLKMPQFKTEDWGDLFFYLAKETAKGQVLIILDEINWIGDKDPTFLGKLKTAWDQYFSKNPKLILILCGSLSGWIEKNIITNTGFVGRISKTLTLEELPLSVCDLFWKSYRNKISVFEKFKFLSISGGVPKYLEEMLPEKPTEKNILDLCFQRDGFLVNEFEQLFHDLFSKKSPKYKTILRALATGPKDLENIYQALRLKKTGYIVSEYMDDLEEGGFIQRDYTWNVAQERKSKLSAYRLSDNYSRFYLKYIEPKKERIMRNSITKVPSFECILGLQFENLVLNNRQRIYELLSIDPATIIFDNPYFQTATKRQQGCQIDYMIQTEHGVLYVVEIKFSKRKVPALICKEMQEKISQLATQKNLSVRPVLLHVNGISDALKKSGYFTNVLNFSNLLSK